VVRRFFKRVALTVGGLVLGVAASNDASAQFFPQNRPAYQRFGNPSYSPLAPYFTPFGFNPLAPHFSSSGFSWSGMQSGQPFWLAFPPPPSAYNRGYNYGGYGTYAGSSASANPILQAQLRAFANAFNPPVANEMANRKPAADKGRNDPGIKPRGIRPNEPIPFSNVPEEFVNSGKSINDLVLSIRASEAKGAKTDAPLFPTDLLRQIRFGGGPAAEVLMLLRTGEIEYPAAMAADEFAPIRNELERPLSAIVGPMLAGKKLDPLAGDRLLTTVKKVRMELKPMAGVLPKDDQTAIAQFLDRLGYLADVAKSPVQYAGLIVPKWFSIGVNASEFSGVLAKHKIAVAPTDAASREAYQVLHQGLAGYDAMLQVAK